jgi:hypothetical protein
LYYRDQFTYQLRVANGSAAFPEPTGADYVHAEGGAMPGEGQQPFLYKKDENTYTLRKDQGLERVSSLFCNDGIRLHTR